MSIPEAGGDIMMWPDTEHDRPSIMSRSHVHDVQCLPVTSDISDTQVAPFFGDPSISVIGIINYSPIQSPPNTEDDREPFIV